MKGWITAMPDLASKERLSKLKTPVTLYYVAFSLYLIEYIIGHTTFSELLFVSVGAFAAVLQAVALVLLVIKFFMQRATPAGWIAAAIIVLVGFVCWRQSSEGWLFWVALFVVCSDEVRLRPLAAIALAVATGMFLVVVSCSSLGIIENQVRTRGNGTVRYALGFTHPNYVGLMLLVICASFSALRFGKNPLPDMLLIVAADIFNLAFADSRTAVAVSVVQAALLLVFYCVGGEPARRRTLAAGGVLVMITVVLSFFLMVFYDASNPLMSALNSALSGRLYLANAYYKMQGLTLFGSSYEAFSPIYWDGGKPYSFVVDNAWCHLLLHYGVIATALFLLGIIALLKKIVDEVRWDALTFGLLLMFVYSFTESFGLRFECNYFLFAMGPALIFGLLGNQRKAVGNLVSELFLARGSANGKH